MNVGPEQTGEYCAPWHSAKRILDQSLSTNALGSPTPLLDPNSDTSASVESHEIHKWA